MKIVNVMAASLDGHIALYPKESDEQRSEYGFSIPADKEFVRQQIHTADAIITGADSMRASSGTWQEMRSTGGFPRWVVLTTKGLEPSLLFWKQSNIPRILVSPEALPANRIYDPKVENWFPEHPDKIAEFTAHRLRDLGCKRVLLFGGGRINKLFYMAGLVNELNLTLCPLFLAGKDSLPLIESGLVHLVKFELLSSHSVQSHVFLKYRVTK